MSSNQAISIPISVEVTAVRRSFATKIFSKEVCRFFFPNIVVTVSLVVPRNAFKCACWMEVGRGRSARGALVSKTIEKTDAKAPFVCVLPTRQSMSPSQSKSMPATRTGERAKRERERKREKRARREEGSVIKSVS